MLRPKGTFGRSVLYVQGEPLDTSLIQSNIGFDIVISHGAGKDFVGGFLPLLFWLRAFGGLCVSHDPTFTLASMTYLGLL